jgi:outer membrane immunogenic protein
MMKKLLRISAALAALIGPATAAESARPVYKQPVVAPPPVSDWSGIYVGLEGGYGWGEQSTNATPGDQFLATILFAGSPATLTPPLFFPGVVPSIRQNGWLFGGFFGAQRQWGNWVLGIEGDIDDADIKGSGLANASLTSAGVASFTNLNGNKSTLPVFRRRCHASPSTTTCRWTPRSMRSHRHAEKSAGHLRQIG